MPLGAEHARGEQKNVDGDKTPRLQLRDGRGVGAREGRDEVASAYPLAHAAVQLEPESTAVPCEQDGLAAFETLGAGHGSGSQENMDGDKTPRLQLREAALAVYPVAQAAVQLEP
jgi:hypothetical protein